jgi:hypothetical protein
MNVKELQQKTDRQLNAAYIVIRDFVVKNSNNSFANEIDFDSVVTEYLPRQYYKARETVKKVKVALNELTNLCNIHHVHESPETKQWSDMEAMHFNTFNEDKYQQVMRSAFNS